MSLSERYKFYQDIHALADKLGMNEDSYRQMLVELTGFSSCVELRPSELREVLKHLKVQAGLVYNPAEIVSDEEALAVLA
ncbi:MAG: DUF1018 domain-containing protein [Trueperaceae bacterium]|nr:DUF1018 domain-containing protein [Trueperaceae bacterium]